MTTGTCFSAARAQSYDMCGWLVDPILAQWLVEHLLPYGRGICDIGAGTGHLLHSLTTRFRQIELIEPSPAMFAILKTRTAAIGNPAVQLYQAGAEMLPLRDKSVDIALAKSTLHHLSEPLKCIHEMARIARNAIAVVEVVSPDQVDRDPACLNYVRRLLLRKEPSRRAQSIFSEEDICGLVSPVASEQRSLHFDQYIDIGSWLEYSDLSLDEKQDLYRFVDGQPNDIKKAMQIHYRDGRLVQHRRMLLLIGLLKARA